MIEELIKYTLNAEEAEKYIYSNLENCNTLCESVLKYTPFKKGEFFTFLRKGLTDQQVNLFQNGNVGGKVKEKIAFWLVSEYENRERVAIIFDADDLKYEEEKSTPLFSRFGVNRESEVFYLLSKNDLTEDNIATCLYESDIIWHSLSVLSSYPYKHNKDKSISKEELESIAKAAGYVLILAYDQEGYIIWKRTK